jgi:hypothetical protein
MDRCGKHGLSGFRRNLGLKAAAVGLAGLIWAISFGLTGRFVRTIPVEFSNVPPGLNIARQSATTLQVQLRGPAWLFESVSRSRLAVCFDIRGLREGHKMASWGPVPAARAYVRRPLATGDSPNSSCAAAGLPCGFSFATSDHRNLLSLSLSTVR